MSLHNSKIAILNFWYEIGKKKEAKMAFLPQVVIKPPFFANRMSLKIVHFYEKIISPFW